MAVFQINQPVANEDSYTVAVNGQNFGSSVDAAAFRSVQPVATPTGLRATFGDAVNDVKYEQAFTNFPTVKPLGMKV